MVKAKPDANFYSLGGLSVHNGHSPEYQEYRRAWQECPTDFVVRDFPLHLDIEITSRCNLRCTFCDKLPVLSKGQMGDMDFPLYRNILDEGAEGRLWAIKLSYRGEPLLHPRVVDMVAYAKARGVLDTYFNTNGMLLTEAMAHRLIDAGLDRISISMEGTDPEAFEKERRGAKFDQIMRNIDNLMELRSRLGCRHPRVRVQTVRLPGIDLEAYQIFWLDHCDEVAAVDYKDSANRVKGLVCHDWACPQLWQRMTIEWSGAIMPCNNDDFRHLCVGNVKEKTVASCWHDPLVQKARELHQRGLSHELQACDGCPWRTTQVSKTIHGE
jgi:radical SAM protein with 4Fe4S-binding SPASM domain